MTAAEHARRLHRAEHVVSEYCVLLDTYAIPYTLSRSADSGEDVVAVDGEVVATFAPPLAPLRPGPSPPPVLDPS